MPGTPVKLIVGLGNPGPQYSSNRHNAGAIFLHHLCKSYGGVLRAETKFYGEFGNTRIADQDIKLLFPTTYMNNSGKSVAAVRNFYKIDPQEMLVAYDEIDFAVGVTRLKLGGGHGGHNGILDIIDALAGNRDFYRLRIGVGHPGHKSLVSNYVLGDPSRADADRIMSDIVDAIRVMPKVVAGNWEEAMQELHTASQ